MRAARDVREVARRSVGERVLEMGEVASVGEARMGKKGAVLSQR